MAMEHRWGRRISVDVGISLHYRPLGRLRGRLRNLSSSGAFVQTSPPLPLNAKVEIVITSGADGTAQIHRLEGVVVRTTPNGIGVMFLQFHRQEFEMLLPYLQANSSYAKAGRPDARPQPHHALVQSNQRGLKAPDNAANALMPGLREKP